MNDMMHAMGATPGETSEQRARRLVREAEYRARKLAADPVGYRRHLAERTRRYMAAHPERAKSATKRWHQNNREHLNEIHRVWRSRNLVHQLYMEAKHRSKARGVEFRIAESDIPPMGEACPLLGTPWPSADDRNGMTTPSLDRIDSRRGYVPGNVWIVGRRANMVKNDGTAAEHEAIAKAMRSRGVP